MQLTNGWLLCIFFFRHSGKTDPYVVLNLGDQEIRSKKNSQTTVIGPPGQPIWNQVSRECKMFDKMILI